MRARQAIGLALIFSSIPPILPIRARADDPPVAAPSTTAAKVPKKGGATPAKPVNPTSTLAPSKGAASPALPALPKGDGDAKPNPAVAAPSAPVVSPGTPAEVARSAAGAKARLDALKAADAKDNPATKPIKEVLERRLQLLELWKKEFKGRQEAEHPSPSPEQVAAEVKVDLERTKALLDQSNKTPDALLPEVFQPLAAEASKTREVRLAEMKEAIDAARAEVKERSTELEAFRGEGVKNRGGEVATLRAARDKAHQEVSALSAGRAEREAAIANAGSAEARELARDKFTNYEWECRVGAESLASLEAKINLASRRLELGSLQAQAKAGHVELGRKLLELMEKRYAWQSEQQQDDLKRAVAKEESRAAQTDDVLERYRAQRSAELLELEAQAVAFEKAGATTTAGLSVSEQTALADGVEKNFEDLKKLLSDGNVSPLDVLRLKNEFRRIGPQRAAIIRGELAAVKSASTTYENALADAEIDLVNDTRDDRYDRESLLDKLPEARRHDAEAMLEAMEVRHRALLNRSRDVLQKLAQRSDDTQTQVLRRIRLLDEQYAFIRTHIFWVRDVEPVGPSTLAHARDEAIRAARALIKLACEPWDRRLWGKVSPDFVLAMIGLVVLPIPLRLGQRAMDRLRLAAPDPGMTPETAPSPVVG